MVRTRGDGQSSPRATFSEATDATTLLTTRCEGNLFVKTAIYEKREKSPLCIFNTNH